MRMLLLTAAVCLACLPLALVAKGPTPLGDLSVHRVEIISANKLPKDVSPLVDGQYLQLATQLQMIHEKAIFGVIPEKHTLIACVPGLVDTVTLLHRQDCAINSGFDVRSNQITLQEPTYDDDELPGWDTTYTGMLLKNKYKAVLVAWTKSRHGVYDQLITYEFTPGNGDVTLDERTLVSLRKQAASPAGQHVAHR